MMMGKILGLVTARGGSKGLIDKNIRPLAGRPLIAWTLDAAHESTGSGPGCLDRVVVSTDSERISDICRQHGAETPFCRPADLARDHSPHIDVVLHALEWLRRHESYVPQWVMLLQPTSPFRTASDIHDAIQLAARRDAPAVVSVCETHAHPYLMRSLGADGTMAAFMQCPIGYARRQDLPTVYALNGAIYLVRRETLVNKKTLEPPGAVGYVMPPDRSHQIDTAWDLRIAELIARDRIGTDEEAYVGAASGVVEPPRRISEK